MDLRAPTARPFAAAVSPITGAAALIVIGPTGIRVPTAAATSTDGTGAGIPWVPIVVVSVAMVVLFVLARVLLHPHARPVKKRIAASPDDAVRSLGDAQWFHDQASVDVLAGAAETAPARWATQRPVVDGIVSDALRRGSRAPQSGWNELAASVAVLQRALDAATAARSDTSSDPADVAESAAEVDRAREQLRSQIDQVRRRV